MALKNIKFPILALPRIAKRLIVVIIDSSLNLLAVWIAYYLRIGEFLILWKKYDEYYALPACIAAIAISLLTFTIFKFYNTIFRYSGLRAIITIGKAFIVYALIFSTIFTVIGITGVPRTVGILQPMILFIFFSISRFVAVYWLGGIYLQQHYINKKPKALIYGAGSAGRQLASNLLQSAKVNVVGFIDDNISLQGNLINGLNVYNPDRIDEFINKKNIREIIFALPANRGDKIKDALDKFGGKNIVLRTLSRNNNQLNGEIYPNDIRNLSIDDILGRGIVTPDDLLMRHDISKKVVLVTGAGGSIGSELCRHIFIYKPKKLILLDHSEFALYNIYEELKKLSKNNTIQIVTSLSSITNKKTVKKLLKNLKPDTIFHAAAYKHVHLVEENKISGLYNNIFGTLFLSQAAIDVGVKKFVLISTDKAVRPSNIMGLSKRIAEMILQALSTTQNKTLFSIVRFGNVLGSSGSVLPLFRSQIKSGGPITVTHQDVTRYFMTISEAAQLVIQASAMTKSAPKPGKAAPIYLLDMGNPVKIIDLARIMIELSGLSVKDKNNKKGDIKIQIIGLRPGEKMHEELLIEHKSSNTEHPKIKYSNEVFMQWSDMNNKLAELEKSILTDNENLISKSILEKFSSIDKI